MNAGLFEVPIWALDLYPDAPIGFVRRPHPQVGDYCYWDVGGRKLAVICSAKVESDGKRWMHVSCSRPSSLPTWDDLRMVKDTFIGDRKAIQILPAQAEYVNLHPNVLHLWACLDDDGLPDFRDPIGLI